ncbi:fibrobacter succinogenes major paralogous domain-containing protein [Sinomicrobium sp.]
MEWIKQCKLLVLLFGIFLLGACKKETDQEEIIAETLDINVSFAIKPEPETVFFFQLYYTEEENEPFYQRNPDVVFERILTATDIEDGFTLPIEGLDRNRFAYVTAFADIDGNEMLSEGDVATCYFEHSLREVMKGNAQASNVSHREFLTVEMSEVYTALVPFQAAFEFPIPPVVETVLKFNLYYADAEEATFFEREPDAVVTRVLSGEDIANGFTLSLDNVEDRSYVYATTYLDIDGNGELNHGDIAMGYQAKALSEIMTGEVQADNMAGVEQTTWSMEAWFIDEDEPATDIDGNVYNTVVIGDKEWMVENLKVTRYRNGALISTGLSAVEWSATYSNGRLGAYAVYPFEDVANIDSEEQMIAEYGLLYNGFAVMDERGLAPAGWRVATDEDLKDLEQAIGFTEAQTDATGWRGVGGLMLRSETDWPVNPGTDDLGFKALPAGGRDVNGNFNNFNNRAYFWTSSPNETTPLTQNYRRILEDTRTEHIHRSIISNREGYSIRCVRDKL